MKSTVNQIVVSALSLSTITTFIPAMDIRGAAKSPVDIRSLLDPKKNNPLANLPNLDVPPQPGIDESSPAVVIFRHNKEKSKGGVDIVWNGKRVDMTIPDDVKKQEGDIVNLLRAHFAAVSAAAQNKIPADKHGPIVTNICQIRKNFVIADTRKILDDAFTAELAAIKQSLTQKNEEGAKRFFLAMNRISNLLAVGADPRQMVNGQTIGDIISAEPKIAGVAPVINFLNFIDHVSYVMNRDDFASKAKQDGLQPLDDKFIALVRGAVKYNDAKPIVFLMQHLDWANAKDADADKLAAELKQSQNADFTSAAAVIAKRAELKGQDGNFTQLRVELDKILNPPRPQLDFRPIQFRLGPQDRQGR